MYGFAVADNCSYFGCSYSLPGAFGLATRLLGTSALVSLGGTARRLQASTVVRENQTGSLSFEGVLGDRVLRYSSRMGSADWVPKSQSIQVPAFSPSFRVTRVGVIGPTNLDDPIPVPELGAGVQHRLLYYQGEHATPQGLRLGTPRALLMLDSAF